MTFKEWKESMPKETNTDCVFAADTPGGFGKKGWTAYGEYEDLDVISAAKTGENSYKVELWDLKNWGPIEKEDTPELD